MDKFTGWLETGEMVQVFDIDKPKYGQCVLSLCKKKYHFKVDDFTDERVKQKETAS